MAKNVASSGFTAVQVGTVGGRAKPAKAKSGKPGKGDSGGAVNRKGDSGGAVNHVSGNARVGVAADVIEGGITVTF